MNVLSRSFLSRRRVSTVVFAALAAAVFFSGVPVSAQDFRVTLHYPVIKRPLDPAARTEAIESISLNPEEPQAIWAASGEYELAVIGVHAVGSESVVDGGGAVAPAPAGDEARGGVPVPTVTELVVDTRGVPAGMHINAYALPPFVVERKTRWFDGNDVLGAWFDPCVPLTRRVTDETVVFDLLDTDRRGVAGSRYLLIEFLTPADESGHTSIDIPMYVVGRTQPGEPADASRRVRTVPPISLELFPFNLPKTHSLPMLMDLEGDGVLEQHRMYGLLPEMEQTLWLEYLTLLRKHRIVPYNPAIQDDFTWDTFESVSIPLWTGALTPDGVPAPAIQFPENPYPRGTAERRQFYRDVGARLREEGLLRRAFYYVDDEPLLGDYTDLISDAREIRNTIPELRTLLTEPYNPRLEGLIDIWCPDIPMFDSPLPVFPLYGKGIGLHPDFQVDHGIDVYTTDEADRRELWMYTCTSAQIGNYPNMFIDTNPAGQRIIPWLLRRYDAGGMVYFRMNHAYYDGNDPWVNQYYFAANGDGTVLYPQHPDLGWSDEHGAVASLRLKLLRDGMEDDEYLRLASRIDTGASEGYVTRIVSGTSTWEHDLDAIVAARNELGRIVSEEVVPPEPDLLRFNQVSKPSFSMDYWFVPGWAAPSERDSGFLLPSYRHLVASALDTGHRTANVTTRGRWQVYLQAGGAAPLHGDTLDYGGYSAIGWNVSLETARRLNRNWLIPYLGFEAGVLTGSDNRETFAGFAGSVLAGVHLFSTERASLLLGGAWTHTTTDVVPVALRGTLAFDFVIGD